MCGRYIFSNEENEFAGKIIAGAKKSLNKEIFEKISLFDVFPSDQALVVTANKNSGQLHVSPMKWGYRGRNGRIIINARSETAFQDNSFFSGSVPCAVPCSGYYEWSSDKQKYTFDIDEPFFLGGLCRFENNELYFVILTEEASFPQNEIHDRQPVLFTYKNIKAWTECSQPALLLKYSVKRRNMHNSQKSELL